MAEPKKKILFIEDEPDQRLILSLRLKKKGFAVSAAENGRQGLEKAEKERPDLILLDVIMPDMDGMEVARRLRQNPVTQKIPIIAATAAGVDDVEHQCSVAGVDDCIRKPYDSADLMDKINALLGL